jgi:GH24 family phage-related lysozyme (muramidase)
MADLSLQLLTEEEGPSRALVYRDSRGYLTISRACLVDPNPALHAEGLCQAGRDAQDAYDLGKAKTLASSLPGFQRCSDVRQAVLVSMCFQLGSLLGWPQFRAALAMGDYGLAADNMLYSDVSDHTKSDWDKQTSTRCEREAWMMRNNAWLPHGAEIPAA